MMKRKMYLAGASLLLLLLGSGCASLSSPSQRSYDLGYQQGQLDSIKRHYWMLQQHHEQMGASEEEGRLVYYTIPAQTTTVDGRLLSQGTVTIPIVE